MEKLVKFSEEKNGMIFGKYTGYKAHSMHFDVFVSDSICVGPFRPGTTEEAKNEAKIELESNLNKITEAICKYLKTKNYIFTPELIVRMNLDGIDSYFSGVMVISKWSIEKVAEYFVEKVATKLTKDLEFCNGFIEKANKGELNYSNFGYKNHGDYDNIKSFWSGLVEIKDIKPLLGKDPLDSMLDTLKELNELLKNKNKIDTETIDIKNIEINQI